MRFQSIIMIIMSSQAVGSTSAAFTPYLLETYHHRKHSVATRRRGSSGLPSSKRGMSTTLRMGAHDTLAKEGEWAAYLDEENTGLVYYFNGKTGESLWEAPTDTFPAVCLSPEQIENMKRKQSIGSYGQEKEAAVASAKSGGAFNLAKVFGSSKEEASDSSSAVSTIEREDNGVRRGGSKAEKGSFLSSMLGKQRKSSIGTEENAIVDDAEAQGKSPNGVNGAGAERASSSFAFPSFGTAAMQERPTTADRADDIGEKVSDPASTEEPEVETPTFSMPDVSKLFKTSPEEKDYIIPVEKPISLEVSSFVRPHPEKVSWGGEDAVFWKGRTFGVFDGVSGADKLDGIALYSITLAEQMKRSVGPDGLTFQQMQDSLLAAAEYADDEATGASTAVVASIGEDGFLRAINLGDSSVMVIRDGVAVAKSKEIVHFFDCPYQLAEESPDRPKDSTKLKVEVTPRDIVIMGSDGVFDNLSENAICSIVDGATNGNAKPAAIARQLVDEARRISLDGLAETPYAQAAKKEGYEMYEDGLGGKVDDIGCVVVRCS